MFAVMLMMAAAALVAAPRGGHAVPARPVFAPNTIFSGEGLCDGVSSECPKGMSNAHYTSVFWYQFEDKPDGKALNVREDDILYDHTAATMFYDRTYMDYQHSSSGAIFNLGNESATALTCFSWKFDINPTLTRDYLKHAEYTGPVKYHGQETHSWQMTITVNGEKQVWNWYTTTDAVSPEFVGFESPQAKAKFWFNSKQVVAKFADDVFMRPTIKCDTQKK